MASGVRWSVSNRREANAGATAPALCSSLIWLVFAAKLFCGAFLGLGSDDFEDWKLAEKLDPGTEAFRRCCEEDFQIPRLENTTPDSYARYTENYQKMQEKLMASTKEANGCFSTSPGASRLEKQILEQDLDFAEVVELLGQFIKWEKAKFGHPLPKAIDMDAATSIFKRKYDCGIIVFPMGVVPNRSTAEKTGEAPKPLGESPHDDKYKGWFTFHLSKGVSNKIKVEMTFQPTSEEFLKGTSWTYSGTFKFVPSGKLKPLYYCGNFTDEVVKTRLIADPVRRKEVFGDEDLMAKIEERKKFKSGRLVDFEESCSLQSLKRLGDGRLTKEMKWKKIDKPGKDSPTRSYDGRVSRINEKGQIEERLLSIIGIEGTPGFSNRPIRYSKRAEENLKLNDDETVNVFWEEEGNDWELLSEFLGKNGRKRHKALLSRGNKSEDTSSKDAELSDEAPWNNDDLTNSCPMGHLVSILDYEPQVSKAVKRAELNQEKNTSLMAGDGDQSKKDSPSTSNRYIYSGIFLVTMIAAFAAAALLKRPHRQTATKKCCGLKGQ